VPKYCIRYGIGGGYNDITFDIIEANSLDEAADQAYQGARDKYDSYGLEDKVAENHDEEDWEALSEEDKETAVNEDFESWAEYSARDYVPVEHDELVYMYGGTDFTKE
jgi:hypothetical protein